MGNNDETDPEGPAKLVATLDDVFFALSDRARRSIVETLAGGEATVGAAADGLDLAPPSVSKHVKVLERAGLVQRRVVGRQHWLSLAPDGFATAAAWFAHHEQFWAGSLDRLAALVTELEQRE
jgi:DNA-binding transcriptional ArsR family regulator